MSMCKVCFKEIRKNGINSFLNDKATICQTCFNQFDVLFKTYKIEGIKCVSIYRYNSFFQRLLFLYKGCYDIELGSVFLERFLFQLKIRYLGYIIVPLPSTKEDDDSRGFNHVENAFSYLGLPIYKIIFKKIKFKQSDLTKDERKKIYSKLGILKEDTIKHKKVLIVDDVLTTGESIKAAIKLLRPLKPRKIEVLTLSINIKAKK